MNKILENKKFFYLIFFFNQLCSFRYFVNSSTFEKNIIYFYLYLIIGFIFYLLFFKKKIINFLLKDCLFYLILLIYFVILLYMYPFADNMKFNMQGSDQDDCYIDIINNFRNNRDAIYTKSYLGNPCSTGLLAFLFYFPLIIWKNYFIIIPVIFLLIYKFSNQYLFKDSKISNLLAIILLSNLLFVELSVAGSDYISISISYFAGCVFLIEGLKKNNNYLLSISFFFLLFFFGSRSVLLFLLIPLAIVFYKNYKIKKLFIFFTLLFIFVIFSFLIPYYLFLPQSFPPFHLFSKTLWFLNNIKYLLILALFFIFIFKTQIVKFLNINFLFYTVGIIAIPMIIGSFSGFLINLNNLDKWEELNYLIIFVPTFSSFLTAIYFKIKIK